MPFVRTAAGVLLTLLAGAALAQEPAPARLTGAMLREDGSIGLTLAWRFRAGDDLSWSSPALDDRAWPPADPQLRPGMRPPQWKGTGWFRRHVLVDEALQTSPIALRIEAPGNAEVFIDGVRVLSSPAAVPGGQSGSFRELQLRGRSHLFAVRYSCDCAGRSGPVGFQLSLERPGALESRALHLQRIATLYGAFIAIPAVLAALHLGLFVFYPKARENLFCAMCLLAFSALVLTGFGDDLGLPDALTSVFATLTFVSIVVSVFFGLMTYYAMSTERVPRTWVLFAVLGALLVVVSLFVEQPAESLLWIGYFAASLLEIVRVQASGRTIRRERSTPLFVGMVLLDAAIVWQIAIIFGGLAPPFGFGDVYIFGVMAFSVATSLYVASSFARTSLNLERRLEEVQALSHQVLDAERESARKGMEIEAARTLQRSILPSSIPVVKGLEIAARVTTATEVGGDYYDFRIDGDDAVIVAVGDAAGHGVAAGAMVTATKALFSSLAGERHLASILAQCDRVLRGMNVRPLHMCLLLARVSPRGLAVTSAAMPRVLHFVAARDSVEEIAAGGPPLAAGLRAAWEQEDAALAVGDVLLFASDGLAEALSADGEPLGYDEVTSLFARALRGRSAAGIVDELLREAERWRGSREQSDDIAVVVVRVTA